MEFHYLANHEDRIPELAAWFEAAWEPFYGPHGPGDAEHDLRECLQKETLPIAIFATENGELCGTAALKEHSVTTHNHLSPWIGALLVRQDKKPEHLDVRLIILIEQMARSRGFEKIYFGAEREDQRLVDHGWTLIDKTYYFTSEVFIYEKELSNPE